MSFGSFLEFNSFHITMKVVSNNINCNVRTQKKTRVKKRRKHSTRVWKGKLKMQNQRKIKCDIVNGSVVAKRANHGTRFIVDASLFESLGNDVPETFTVVEGLKAEIVKCSD